MNDRRLITLARMAEEIDEFERVAGAVAPVTAPRPALRPVIARLGGPLLAVAAGLAVVAGLALLSRTPETPRKPMASAKTAGGHADPAHSGAELQDPLEYASRLFSNPVEPSKPHPVAHAGSSDVPPDESLVLAIVQDPLGGVQCVSWSRQAGPSAAQEGLAPTELARQVCRADCVDGPHWLVAAKVTGPHGAMPADDEGVHALAACILDARHDRCDSGPSTIASGANYCVPAGLRVTVERRSMASRPGAQFD